VIDDDPIYPPFIQVCRYVTTGKNLRTMIAIFPFFTILQFYPSPLSSVNIFFTIGRFMTLLKLTDFISSRRSSHIINNTLLRAYPTLLYMIWTVLIVAILMSSIIFLTERGSYTVNEDYPHGAFLRPNYLHSVKEESPFKSVLISMYYVLVTMTSTGYGDLYCTSSLGRALSNLLMCSAVFILALPIAVLGNILSEEVDKYLKRKEERNETIRRQLLLTKGKKFPTYRYRYGPSFDGAKEIVGQTFRRLSSITMPRSGMMKAREGRGKGRGGGGGGTENGKGLLPISSLEETPSPNALGLNKQRRRSSGAMRRGSGHAVGLGTLETVKRLSANSQVIFVESTVTHQPFEPSQQSQEKVQEVTLDDDNDDDLFEQGIVLNPITSKVPQVRRASPLTKIFPSPSPLAREIHQNNFSHSPSPPPPHVSPSSSPSLSFAHHVPSSPSIADLHHQLRDIEQQIDHLSQVYQDRLKDCLDIYQQIQTQMRIRNDLLQSLLISQREGEEV
jgi:hypothetical protein